MGIPLKIIFMRLCFLFHRRKMRRCFLIIRCSKSWAGIISPCLFFSVYQ